jgi:DNA-binding transcriptional MocR family regulator
LNVDLFYRTLLEQQGTYVGPGHWFDQDRHFSRLSFAWPTEAELRSGLEGTDRAAAAARS